MTASLLDCLLGRIRKEGAITIAAFMGEALQNSRFGYYRAARPIGGTGDFITAPEISQMYGELIGLWSVESWERLGPPSPFSLIELGPGRGTLMKDALRAARVRPRFLNALSLHLLERHHGLRAEQRAALASIPVPQYWHEEVTALPEGPAIIIASEFFDALPIHQFQFTPEGWRERRITVNADGRLALALDAPSVPLGLVLQGWPEPEAGEVREVSPAAMELMAFLAARLKQSRGAMLVIDYGHWNGRGDSLQAIKAHRKIGIFEAPGESDLTAYVNFAALAEAAQKAGLSAYGPVRQGEWLRRLGIEARAAQLAQKSDAAGRGEIAAALHRLTHPLQMGGHFQVMAFTAGMEGIPAGFEGEIEHASRSIL